jgi:hypothetical protein
MNKHPLTLEETERYEWCLSVLDEEHIVECQDEADVIAQNEANAPRAYQELLPLLVKMRVHQLEAEQK